MRLDYRAIGLSIAVSLCLCACAKPPSSDSAREDEPKPAETSKPDDLPPPTPAGTMSPATLDDARQALSRIYEDTVVIDATRNKPLIVGDFNGDGYQDAALIVRPNNAKLADINSEVANWIIKDALAPKPQAPDLSRNRHALPPRSTIGEKDIEVVAVIHGFGPKGWLDDQARQTYLLRNAAGQGMRTVARKVMIENRNLKKPALIGDVIEETIGGRRGFLYYTGATYAWFNPLASAAESPGKTVH
jgi:hypothetical protein